ncbi:replicative DNA helicase [Cupriavidus pinatubonensis]|uniref:replicative DNA helicase n=1 Tax=Cupriavidus pinatubonensis TaxID=248026 RepID=UPI001C739361|nr:replicative DNA helicase [Cupriavidus pinatubonensis]QYY30259.1 replicative DNA helicase [Cupriavidus pinatubonensis]
MNAPDDFPQARALFSLEAEQAVLGGLLLDNNAVDRINGLDAAHFYRDDHRLVFSQIVQLIVANRPADVVTVFEMLQSQGRAERIGGLGYLTELAHRTPSAANIARYAEIVRDRAMLRETAAAARKVLEMVETPSPMKGAEILDRAQALLGGLAQVGVRREPKFLAELMTEFVEGVDQRYHGTVETAIPTGIDSLDRALNGGLRRGNLVIVAGRPSMGKTALTTEIGLNQSTDYSVLLLSMEMSDQEIVARAAASRGTIRLSSLLNRMEESDWPRLTYAVQACADLNFAVDDSPALTLLEVRMKAKAHQRKHGLDVLIVDYLGLMTGGEEKMRTQQIGAYSRGLKALAKELNIPVIALAQLSRKNEDRPDKKPILSDLRDSGDIEQDADVVMFVHRPEMYDPNNTDLKGYAEVLIRKQRNGALGDVPLLYRGAVTKFDEWTGPLPMLSGGPAVRKRGIAAEL